MLVSIVTPTKNSSALLHKHYEEVTKVILNEKYDYEILYVDDGSHDSSPSLITTLSQSDPMVRGIFLNSSYGQQTAISVGFTESKGDVNITLDVDLEIPAQIIPSLVREIIRGNDYVPVQRIKRINKGLFRALGSRCFNVYMRIRTGLPIRDFGCGAAGHSKDLIERMRNSTIPNMGLKHLAGQLATTLINFPVDEERRNGVKSSYNFSRLLRAFAVEHKVKIGLVLPPKAQIKMTRQIF